MYRLSLSNGTACYVVLNYYTLTDVTEALFKLFKSTTELHVELWREDDA